MLEQERYCDVDMMQNWNYKLDGTNIANWEETYTEKTGYETQDIDGTKVWDSTTPVYTSWVDTGVIGNCNTWMPIISNQKVDFRKVNGKPR